MRNCAIAVSFLALVQCNGLCGIDEATELESEAANSSAVGAGGPAGPGGPGGAGGSGGRGGSPATSVGSAGAGVSTSSGGLTTYCDTVTALLCEDFDRAGGELANLQGWQVSSPTMMALQSDGPQSSPMFIRFGLPMDRAGSSFDVSIHRSAASTDLPNVHLSFYLRVLDRNAPTVWMRVCELAVGGHTLELTLEGDNPPEAPLLKVAWDSATAVLSTETTGAQTVSIGRWHPIEIDLVDSVLTVAMDGAPLENPSSHRTTYGTGPLSTPLEPEVSFGIVNGSGGPHGEIDVRVDTVVLTASN